MFRIQVQLSQFSRFHPLRLPMCEAEGRGKKSLKIAYIILQENSVRNYVLLLLKCSEFKYSYRNFQGFTLCDCLCVRPRVGVKKA